jgi:hypothetical protein
MAQSRTRRISEITGHRENADGSSEFRVIRGNSSVGEPEEWISGTELTGLRGRRLIDGFFNPGPEPEPVSDNISQSYFISVICENLQTIL